MGTTEELDPEGYLIERAREILGEEIPFVFTGDIHDVTTARMLRNADGMAIYHTYPPPTSQTPAEGPPNSLCACWKVAWPVIARAVVPALVRGNELITETGLFGNQVRFAKSLYDNPKVLNAGMQIGNPFTDVPEVCSQAIVITDGDEELAREFALKMAREFWPNRAKMQGVFTGLEESVREAANLESPIMFTDAADAPSSGSPGDSNAIIEEIVRQGQRYSVLAPIVDTPTAAKAHELGGGATFPAMVGGDQDPRYTPLELELTAQSLYEGDDFPLESWGGHKDPGLTAVLTSANLTMDVHSNPINLVDRALFFANGLDPKDFHATVVKSPHCEPPFFEDYVTRNFNVDAPGSTSANLPTLGHTNVKRPIYPLDEDVEYTGTVEIYTRG
jgi:microcystin degradation protein MlrC